MASSNQQAKPITSLSLEELNQVKGSLEQEIARLDSGLEQLQGALTRYEEAKKGCQNLNSSNLEKEILIPITSSISFL